MVIIHRQLGLQQSLFPFGEGVEMEFCDWFIRAQSTRVVAPSTEILLHIFVSKKMKLEKNVP